MKTALQRLCFIGFVVGVLGCKSELYPTSPPVSPPSAPNSSTACQAPSIEKNIIGTWHFESTYDLDPSLSANTTAKGTVTFTTSKTIIDADSLFRIHFIGPAAQPTTFEADTTVITPGGNFGRVFAVYLHGTRGTQIDAFTVTTSTCNEIRMQPSKSDNNKIGIVLTRN